MVVTDGGYVGIGNVYPTYPLEVAGDILASNSYMTGGYYASGSSGFDSSVSVSGDLSVYGDDVLFQPTTNKEGSFIIATSGWVYGDDYGTLFEVDTNTSSVSINGNLSVYKDFNIASGAVQHDYSSGNTYIDRLNMGNMALN